MNGRRIYSLKDVVAILPDMEVELWWRGQTANGEHIYDCTPRLVLAMRYGIIIIIGEHPLYDQ